MANSCKDCVRKWLVAFDKALLTRNVEELKDTFTENALWRDLVSFTWNIKTMEGRHEIGEMITATIDSVRPSDWEIDGEVAEADGITEAWLRFQTSTARCIGHVRLMGEQAMTLLTTAQELKGHEERKGPTRELGVVHGAVQNRETWSDVRSKEVEELGNVTQPYVVIIGGGQGGIALAARLRQLNVPTIVIEKNDRPGDSWRKRYKSLCLHDPVWYDHMPYLPFPEHWPVFTPKDKMGDWLESYVKIMELNYWSRTTCTSASFDKQTHEWTVPVMRDGLQEITLKPKHLVIATGMAGLANIPNIPGIADFQGDVHHSSQHPGPDAYRGKRAVIVGSNNSAHDIAAALWEGGVSEVTMIQRSSTHVSRSATLMEISLGPLYSEEALSKGITTDKADLIFASIPYRMLPAVQKPGCDLLRQRDADFYDRLKKAGFLLDFGADDTGLFMKYLRRASGYYIDVGASELVASGKIKLAHGQVSHAAAQGLVLDVGGTEQVLPADLIVLATGYGSMTGWVAQLLGQDTADKVGRCWGLGSDTDKDPGPWEGELRNMWKPTQQEALWIHGGNLHQSRHYSQFLALQLKARHAGIATPVYGLQPVHHKA